MLEDGKQCCNKISYKNIEYNVGDIVAIYNENQSDVFPQFGDIATFNVHSSRLYKIK